ncbi:hypothetical protein FKM82_026379 [Ascaphus truei]
MHIWLCLIPKKGLVETTAANITFSPSTGTAPSPAQDALCRGKRISLDGGTPRKKPLYVKQLSGITVRGQ